MIIFVYDMECTTRDGSSTCCLYNVARPGCLTANTMFLSFALWSSHVCFWLLFTIRNGAAHMFVQIMFIMGWILRLWSFGHLSIPWVHFHCPNGLPMWYLAPWGVYPLVNCGQSILFDVDRLCWLRGLLFDGEMFQVQLNVHHRVSIIVCFWTFSRFCSSTTLKFQ